MSISPGFTTILFNTTVPFEIRLYLKENVHLKFILNEVQSLMVGRRGGGRGDVGEAIIQLQ